MQGQVEQFRNAAARRRYSLSYTKQWATGSRTTIPLDNVGYLNELQILASLTVDVTTTGTVTDAVAAKTNYFPTIGLRSPAGTQIWQCSSRNVDTFNYRLDRGMNPSKDDSYTTWAPGTLGNQNVNYRLRIPCAVNDGRNFDMGMLMRQISNNQFFLDLQMAALSDLVGSGSCVATISGNIYVEEVYYDAVTDGSNVQPPNFDQYIRLRELQSNSLQNGSNDVRFDTGPILLDAFFTLINNSAADATITNLTNIEVKANRSSIELRTGSRLRYDQTMHLGQSLPNGVYHEDFCDDMGQVNSTLGRDFINSDLASQLDFMVQYAGTPSGTSYIDEFFRELITVAA